MQSLAKVRFSAPLKSAPAQPINSSAQTLKSSVLFKNASRLNSIGKRSNILNKGSIFPATQKVKSWLDAPSVPENIVQMPSTKIDTLPNFMKVASENHGGETATISVCVDAGSVYESEAENGVAHFLEHMAFKGTQKRTRAALEEEIENMGASLNAYTSRESTVFWMKCFKNDVERAMEILSDILGHSALREADIEAERSTILREHTEVNKDHAEVVFDYLHAAAFQGTPLGRTILGPVHNIKNLKKQDLANYIKKYYIAPRMVLAGAGAVNHESLVGLANKYFGNFPSYPDQNKLPDMEKVLIPEAKTPFTGTYVGLHEDDMDEVHFAIAFEGVGWQSPDYFPMLLVQTMIGNWDKNIGGAKNLTSRFAELCSKEELGTSFNCFNTCYYDTGLFGIYGISDEHRAQDMVFEAFNSLLHIAKNSTQRDLDRAKEKLKANLLMQLDGNTAIAEEIGRQVLTYKKRISPNVIFGRINSVTLDDIRRAASDHCEDTDPSVVAMGPIALFPDYNQMRNWTFWNRW